MREREREELNWSGSLSALGSSLMVHSGVAWRSPATGTRQRQVSALGLSAGWMRFRAPRPEYTDESVRGSSMGASAASWLRFVARQLTSPEDMRARWSGGGDDDDDDAKAADGDEISSLTTTRTTTMYTRAT